jgi:hypothetical protein
MVEPGSDKTAGTVAYATVLVSLYVIGRFALGKHAVVARLAVIDNPEVIEGCRCKACSDVALTTVTVGRHVIARLALGDVAVVALGAVVERAVVIEPGASKCRRVVAG